MSLITKQMAAYLESGSWIRRMFEAGISLRQEHGADAVCDFSLGNPDLPAPAVVGQELQKLATKAGEPFFFGYMPNAGFGWAREKLAVHIAKEQHIPLTANEVLITAGAAGAINVLFRAILEAGDEVLSFAPCFVEYRFYIENHQGVFRTVATTDAFLPDLQALEDAITAKTRALIINSPNNPTGQIYPEATLREIAGILQRKSQQFGRPIYLVADEPYRLLAYDGHIVPPILPLYEHAVVINSFSKSLSLPGERIGYLALSPLMEGRESLMAALIMTNRILGFVNPPVLGQYLMVAALESSVDASIYKARRDTMADVLTEAGYEFLMPKGAFYFFPKAPGGDDVAFVNRLQKELVLAVPGSGFMQPGYFRLAFCVDAAIIRRSLAGFKAARG